SASQDGTVRLWDVAEGKELYTLKGHSGAAYTVSFSGNSRLASCGGDNTVRLWDVVAGHELAVLKEHKRVVYGVSLSPDGRRGASAGEDRVVKVWAIGDQAARAQE